MFLTASAAHRVQLVPTLSSMLKFLSCPSAGRDFIPGFHSSLHKQQWGPASSGGSHLHCKADASQLGPKSLCAGRGCGVGISGHLAAQAAWHLQSQESDTQRGTRQLWDLTPCLRPFRRGLGGNNLSSAFVLVSVRLLGLCWLKC